MGIIGTGAAGEAQTIEIIGTGATGEAGVEDDILRIREGRGCKSVGKRLIN